MSYTALWNVGTFYCKISKSVVVNIATYLVKEVFKYWEALELIDMVYIFQEFQLSLKSSNFVIGNKILKIVILNIGSLNPFLRKSVLYRMNNYIVFINYSFKHDSVQWKVACSANNWTQGVFHEKPLHLGSGEVLYICFPFYHTEYFKNESLGEI